MKKLSIKFSIIFLFAVVALTSACARPPQPVTAPAGGAHAAAPSAAKAATVAFARAAGRVGLSIGLKELGLPPEAVSLIMNKLREFIDGWAAGKDIRELVTSADWTDVKTFLTTSLASIVSTGSAGAIDTATAEALISGLLDAFVLAVKG